MATPSLEPAPRAERPREGSRRLLVLAGALLLGEYLVVSHSFDARPVVSRGGWWTWLGSVGALGPVLSTTAAAWFASSRLGPGAQRRANLGDPRPVRRLPWLGVHLVSAVALWFVLTAMFGRAEAPEGPAALWFLLWVALVLLTGTSALLMVLGGARWMTVLVRDLGRALPVGVLAWFAGLLSAGYWPEHARYTLEPAAVVLRGLSIEAHAVSSASLLELADWTMQVAPGCGGYEGFGAFFVLALAYAVRFRRALRPARFAALAGLGFFAVWLVNVVRFVLLSVVGNVLGPSAAVASFHSKGSWVLFCAVALAVVAAARAWATQHVTEVA